MKYMKKVVIFSLALCVLYLPVYIVCSLVGIILPDSLTQAWYATFGAELGMTALIKVSENIRDAKLKKEVSDDNI